MFTPSAVFSLRRSAPQFKRSCQFKLFTPNEHGRERAGASNPFGAANREATAIILQSPERYAGLPVLWARMLFEGGARPEGRP
jgi:hypothetical protein